MNKLEGASIALKLCGGHMVKKMSALTCTIFNELSLTGQLCDVLITVDGTEFNAHKNLLCGCSSYFQWVTKVHSSFTEVKVEIP